MIALPPPAPPPLPPKVGPSDDWRKLAAARCPSVARPIVRPIDVTVLPSPAAVGVTALTRMYRPR